ncbi:MAG: peptidase S41 [Flavobacteriales bacterium]|nr:peptidase S41 [Flavobacteriales bacterium]|tara:strand:+ start:17347 stop:18957 length:1611 start_codon:yes stop_codon:yes gene_type:complete
MNKLTLIFCLAFVGFSSFSIAQEKNQMSAKTDGVVKFDNLLTIINYAYVDSVDNKKMVEDAIVGLLKELDPHSVYIPEEDLKAMNEPLEGNFEGIGIQFNILHDTITVVSPISGGPSESLGILSGDRIVTIGGENVAGIGISNKGVADRLRGKKGTVVNVQIKRNGESQLLDFAITRDKIPIYSIDASYLATPDIAYIKVNRFARTTMREFSQALDTLKQKGAESLILDLRGNGGGYLQTAFLMADEFLEQGKMIVYTEGDKQSKEEYKATSRGSFENGKVVVLIDEGSASASEIVSGAIQDWDRGLVIGRRSFGKGLVQKPFPLPDGSMIRLTTARYYTPTGRSIQRPYDNGKKDYYNELNRRYTSGELLEADSIEFPDSLKYFTPNKRVVYGGGGIMPDIFIPIDTSFNSELNKSLIRRGVYNEFTLTHLDKNRKQYLKDYPTFPEFKKSFEIDDDFMGDFFEFADKEKNVEKSEEDYEKSKKLIQTQIKALLARNLYHTSAYFEIINELNDFYIEAINMIQSDSFMKAKLESE